ncbi:hypothetical protein SPBR_05280 [Sporothrix brasiliensis 5110]|uniref:Uncharacterized protein n=1 Tax=Sporothrix brasiliensis 5110 TaxID=1398154 RepID=A0A0C2IFF0_9PEZI|nr:uncharacterized protein SPBR_05280 [Sporothrix brasiliensis 5110]KIH87951.1 hypothetical protein SPBR_05280 [Sporothrix brasiliensis 5110]
MADRHPIYNTSRHQIGSRVGTGAFPRAPRVTATNSSGSTGSGGSASTASTSVRRNLFQSQLTRRPTQATSTASGANSNASNDGLRTGVLGGLDGSDAGFESALASDPSSRGPAEIVVRDRNGELELVDPPSPTADEMSEMALDARQESERERQRLADTIKYHQQRTSIPGQPEELLDALRASLRAKVSALSEDNWMYEPEDMPRFD